MNFSPLAALLLALILSFISFNYILNVNIKLKIFLIGSDLLIVFLTYGLIKLVNIDRTILHTYLLTNQLYADQYKLIHNYLFKPQIQTYSITIDKNILTERLNQNCACCLNIIADKLTILDCKHIYCTDCITPWLQKQDNCPLCKNKF